jgi:hypothetical protein
MSPSDIPDDGSAWPELPTETEVYILPDGQVVVADLPAELAAHLERLGIRADAAIRDSAYCNRGPESGPSSGTNRRTKRSFRT